MHKVVFDYTKKSVNYCVTCKAKGIKKEIIVNKYSTSDICNDCKPKPIDAKSVIDEIKTNAVVKNEAISLLVELRIICGVNYRKYKKHSDSVSNEFMYINKLIDDFREKHKIKKILNQ